MVALNDNSRYGVLGNDSNTKRKEKGCYGEANCFYDYAI